MDPLKAAAAAAFCLVLFWLAFRLTRRLVDLAIAAGHAEERRRAAQDIQAASDAPPQATALCATASALAASGDPSSRSAIGARGVSTASAGIAQGSPAE